MECARPAHARPAVLAAALLAALVIASAGCTGDEPAATAAPTPTATAVEARAPATPAPTPTATAAPTPEPVARFTVSGLMVEGDPGAVKPGDEVILSAKVVNRGNAPGTYEALLTVDGAVSGRQLADLGAGMSSILRFTVRAGGPGDHDVRLDDARLLLRVLGPAVLSVSALEVTPNPAAAGKPLAVYVTVTNTGGEPGTHTVQLRIDGKSVKSSKAIVDGGDEQGVVFNVKAPAAGRHTVSIGDLETTLVVWNIARQANGKILVNKASGGYGRLTIRNKGDRDALVVLAKSSAPSRAVLAVYVRGGKSATVKGIRDGTYVAYFALGSRWDTASRSFTASQEHRQFDDRMRFRTTRTSTAIRYTTWTLTLQASSGGNAPTTSVGEDDFPGVP